MGPGHNGSVFESREELRAAWEQHRDEVMRLWGSHGRRPMAWWEFDAGALKHPGYDRERSTFWRAGHLTADEKAALEREWKAAFAEAAAPDFTLNDGTGILVGDCARAAHYAWADIPRELIRRGEKAERRRRERQSVAPLAAEVAAK